MTKKEFNSMFNELLATTNIEIKKKKDQLLASGAVDIKGTEKNYLLPKTMMVVCLSHCADQWRPVSDEGREELKNLECF